LVQLQQQRQQLVVAQRETRGIVAAVRQQFRSSWDVLYAINAESVVQKELRSDAGWKIRDNLVSRAVSAER